MKRSAVLSAALLITAFAPPAFAGLPPSALVAANTAFSEIDNYSTTVVVHEIQGERVEDRTYHVMFKKPTMERVDIVAGPGKGGGVVWLGGDTVKGHRGGLLSGIHLTLDIHNSQVTTLRGDTVKEATIGSMLGDFETGKGEMTEAAGPQIDGGDTVAVTLDVADAAAYNGVSREILYLSDESHLPVRRERFSGATLVKTENVTEMKTNIGLTASDFPW